MQIVIKGLVPLSYNSRNKNAYQNRIRAALQRKYHGVVPIFAVNVELFARVYFFTSDGVTVDCDNISKPIWDALNGLLYTDDRNIIMRTAAVIDVNLHPFSTIDTSLVESDVAADLMQALAAKDVKCLFLECNLFNESMIKFGINI